jgi:hypothetical protein
MGLSVLGRFKRTVEDGHSVLCKLSWTQLTFTSTFEANPRQARILKNTTC